MKNSVFFEGKNNDTWSFIGNGVVVSLCDQEYFITCAHLFIGSIYSEFRINIDIQAFNIANIDFIEYKTVKRNILLDLAIIKNSSKFQIQEIEINRIISNRSKIKIKGYNILQGQTTPSLKSYSTLIYSTKEEDNFYNIKPNPKIVFGYSGSPIFDENNKLLGIFNSNILNLRTQRSYYGRGLKIDYIIKMITLNF